MPVAPDASFGWQEATIALGVVLIVSFLVTWVITDLLGVSRPPYVGILTVVTLGLGAGYLAWSGTSLIDLVLRRWGWGLLAGAIVGAVLAPSVRRLPSGSGREGGQLLAPLLWEGGVYGVAEGLLLATLPVLAAWQAAQALGWADGGWSRAGSGAMAVAAALLVIAIHHLGYREFRTAAARPKLAGALVGCGLQALAFLLTGNLLAPVVAHIVLHVQLVLRGVEMPPVEPPGSGPVEPVLQAAAVTRLKEMIGTSNGQGA